MELSGGITESWRSIKQDHTVLQLLIANAVLIVLVLHQKWDANVLVWIYWTQM